MRTYAGDTSLPGGKVDKKDSNAEETAVSVLNKVPPSPCLITCRIAERSVRGGGEISNILVIPTIIDVSQIGLSVDKSKVPLLCVLEPFLAGNGVLITP